MTTYAGAYIGDGPVANFYSAPFQYGISGVLEGLFTGVSIQQFRQYKNEGWYAAGSTWETWVTTQKPGTTPPSGHTLVYLQSFPMDGFISVHN